MKDWKLCFFIPLILFLFPVRVIYSTHIVGGDFKITMITNDTSSSSYDIQLRLYRDDVNGAVNLPASVDIGIYQIGTNNLQTTVTLSLNNGSGSLISTGDSCYTPDSTIFRIEEGVYTSLSSVFLPNFSWGYYLQYETCCRSIMVDNLLINVDGISIFAIIPDPAIGQNSSPDFGSYPNDAYWCANNVNLFTWPVTDQDGDSLVFSLVTPLNEGINPNNGNSSPGDGAYPYYPACYYYPGLSQSNPIGGSPQMTINPITGEISASPPMIGYYVFTVRVEEFRNGIKIGEVRRDVQYKSEPCIVSNPPLISLNSSLGNFQSDTLVYDVIPGDSLCLDLDISLNNPLDSIFSKISSNNVDLVGGFVQPINLSSTNTVLSYYDWNNIIGDTIFFNPSTQNSSGYLGSIGNLYFRYCWQDICNSIDTTLNIMIASYSSNCLGVDQSLNNFIINCNNVTNLINEEDISFISYPNPTKENITISIKNFNGNIQIQVYDIIGNILQTTNQSTINLGDYAKGIYVLRVDYEDKIEEIKVIKE